MNNTTDSLAVLDPPAMPLASREPAAEPTIGMILQSAVERGMDPAGMEKLAAIYERELARRSERAFIDALEAFRANCPALVKNREAVDPKSNNRLLYRFIDLSEITKLVDRLLLKHGLTYTWDTDVQEQQVVVTCTLFHRDGHQRSSKFTCRASGTSIMSDAQKSASAVTFGRRYTLTGVLGLTIDEDDDGRRLAEPSPQPPPDPAAPKVATRAERALPADPSRVTAADLNGLLTRHREWTRNPHAGPTELAEWAAEIVGADAKLLTAPRNWTREGVEKCMEAMGA